ncbi:unnamed protein product [Ascophyllum nodosum]
MPSVLSMVRKVEKAETEVVTDQLSREGVEILSGTARFVRPRQGDHRLSLMVLKSSDDQEAASSPYRHVMADTPKSTISADRLLVACGTRPVRPENIPFDGEYIFDSDQLLWGGIKQIPRNLIVVGAGVIGMEYACMINVIPGTTVTVVDPRPDVLPFADGDVIESLQYAMRQQGARFLLKEKLVKVEKVLSKDGAMPPRVVAHFESGKRVVGDALLYTMGRQGNTDSLDLRSVGLEADRRGLMEVNDFYQTSNPRVYACGDVIGYPALASTSMEQGRRAALHMWGQRPRLDDDETKMALAAEEAEAEGEGESADSEHERVKSEEDGGFLGRNSEQLFPYGIYTIPEVSMIGKTEAQLTADEIPYEVGIADYQELARGQMLGGVDGFLKLIFHADTLKLLGVHCIGEGSTEIIHIGQVVMSQGGTIEYFRTAVFNYPTLAEAYTVAAADGLRKVDALADC